MNVGQKQSQNNQGVKKVTLGFILGWGLGVLAAISGVVFLFSKPLSGVLYLLLAVALLPPANKLIADKLKFSISGGLKFVLVIVLLGVIGATTDFSTLPRAERVDVSRPAEEQAQGEEAIKISAVQLSEEYNANKVAADAKYKGKTLEISGVIDNIGKDIVDTPYVTLKGRELSLFGVQCMFGKTDEPKLATLSKGRNITLRGEMSGELIGNVVVRSCQIVE